MAERPILMSAPMVCSSLDDTKTQTRRVVQNHHNNDGGFVLQDYGNGWWPYRSHDGESGCYLDRQKDGDYYSEAPLRCPYGRPGSRLWVRETYFAWGRWETRFSAKKGRDEWHFVDLTPEAGKSYLYAANGQQPQPMGGKRHKGGVTPTWWKRPAIFMPRAASRITLEVTGVRVERLMDISEADALAEGVTPLLGGDMWTAGGVGDGALHAARPQWAYRRLWEQINGPESWSANPWVWVVEFKRLEAAC